MTILWIPHTPPQQGVVRRDEHLIRHLKDKHRIISVTWEAGRDHLAKAFTRGLRFYATTTEDGRTGYHVRRIPDVTRRFRKNKNDALWLNQKMFRRDVRRIIDREEVDVLITAYSCFMTGFPPFDVDIPVVFDYLDCAEWISDPPHAKPYVAQSDLVLAVSALAEEQANRYNDNIVYLPNGADVRRIQQASGRKVRKQYGLEDATVVSLIGLMDSSYLIDAVRKAKKEIPNLKCLLVGHSDTLRAEIEKLPEDHETFIYVGPVPYEEVAEYFAASDVGLYPVRGASHDNGRSPIKVFEYTAAGCPVVTPPIREVKRLDFSNLVYASPTVADFAEGIVKACRTGKVDEPAIDAYSWPHLADRLDSALKDRLSVASGEAFSASVE